MQLHLLYIYQFLSNFAVSLVSTFITLIVLQKTGSLALALGYVVVMSLLRILFVFLLKKQFEIRPQLMLLIRVIPIVSYSVALIFLDTNIWIFLPIVTIMYALDTTLKNCAIDNVLNYNTKPEDTKGVSRLRLFNNCASIVSALLGGVFLGINQAIIIAISVALYLIAVIPLVIYYFKNKSNKTFNKDYTTTAQIAYSNDNVQNKRLKKLTLQMIFVTLITTSFACTTDYVVSFYSLFTYASPATFTSMGIFTAIVHSTKLIGNTTVRYLNKKFDYSILAMVGSLVMALTIPWLLYVKKEWILYLIFATFGYCSSVVGSVAHMHQNRSKIVGAGTDVNIYGRQIGIPAGQLIVNLPGMIFSSIPICMFAFSIFMVINAICWHPMEERVRRNMVDYLQDNEIE